MKRNSGVQFYEKISADKYIMADFSTFAGIMVFYAVLTYILFPVAFYYFMGPTLASAGKGFVVGSFISLALWFFVGSKMV
jgi:hypothetical protein